MKIVVIIPAFNEARSLPLVLHDIPTGLVAEVIVVDNNSTDATAEVARAAGAVVVRETQRGYGKACLAGMAHAGRYNPDAIVFLDADYSDFPGEMAQLVDKLRAGFDLVIGSRIMGKAEKGALLPHARWGNVLAVTLVKVFFGQKYTDLGPFRAIKWDKLMALNMVDENFGWTIEMQIKAARLGLRIAEVPVSYRKRIGVSKVSGTVSGTIRAGYKIIFTIFKQLFAA
ncbi:MAG: glycosyltransferase family 2 protein [bacterium]